jgi:hypothetical protein
MTGDGTKHAMHTHGCGEKELQPQPLMGWVERRQPRGMGGERQQGGGEGGDDKSKTCSQDGNGEQKGAHKMSTMALGP